MNKHRRTVLAAVEAHHAEQGWEFDQHGRVAAEAHLESMVVGLCQHLGIQEQSFWQSYGDLVNPEKLARDLHDASEAAGKAEDGTKAVTISTASATRVLVSLGHVPVSLADGIDTLKSKKGVLEAMQIMTLAGQAVTAIAFAVNKALQSEDPSTVTIPGDAVYGAVTSMTETVKKISAGLWSTGDPEHDEMLIVGISSDRDHLVTDATR